MYVCMYIPNGIDNNIINAHAYTYITHNNSNTLKYKQNSINSIINIYVCVCV